MRRDSNDIQWQEVKEKIYNRDEGCRLLKILSVKEFLIFRKNAYNIGKLDPAHIIPVSEDSSIMYKSWNIVLLNRYSHDMLDKCKSPIDGNSISKEEVNKWWERILKGNSEQYEEFIDNRPNYFEE